MDVLITRWSNFEKLTWFWGVVWICIISYHFGNFFVQRKKKELDEYDRQQGERRAKIFESATEFILNLLAKTNRRFTEYEIHQRLVNTTFLDSGTLRDGKLIEKGPTGTEMQKNITQSNVGQALGAKMSHITSNSQVYKIEVLTCTKRKDFDSFAWKGVHLLEQT